MSEQSGKIERRIYPDELKQEAIRLVMESGLSNALATAAVMRVSCIPSKPCSKPNEPEKTSPC